MVIIAINNKTAVFSSGERECTIKYFMNINLNGNITFLDFKNFEDLKNLSSIYELLNEYGDIILN